MGCMPLSTAAVHDSRDKAVQNSSGPLACEASQLTGGGCRRLPQHEVCLIGLPLRNWTILPPSFAFHVALNSVGSGSSVGLRIHVSKVSGGLPLISCGSSYDQSRAIVVLRTGDSPSALTTLLTPADSECQFPCDRFRQSKDINPIQSTALPAAPAPMRRAPTNFRR